ncbi:MAG TPA: bifunctional DNA-formamidopyrimidine glycosylase/DNA-(apurinic or apyrimidinic site) lyase [Gemmatimonadales bacterium]|nr:bifunctional DNA-formamidopyrimidine glycosylase/DNA-(apurinic or apyrimidinic site) lyase [Gemmatimonadales bacterium]
MPELPEVEAVRRQLEPVMVGTRIHRVELRRADLRAPFPRRFASRLAGASTLALTRRAKYLLAALSSGDTLLMHLGMSGSFRVAGAGAGAGAAGDAHDHVVFHLTRTLCPRGARAQKYWHDNAKRGEFERSIVVVFNDPRRFGFMDLVRTSRLDRHPSLAGLGPEPLSSEFDATALARACAGKRTPLKSALLDQQVVAGLGNIYAVEALHIAGLSPQRRASTIATPAGAPRESARRLADAIKQVLVEAIDRQTSTRYRAERFRVYDREGDRCRRPRCPGVIRRRTQAGRSTFYCAVCQR